jgi:RNA polymerase primary sigma factor
VENGISGSHNLGWDLEEVRFMKSTMPDATSFDRPDGSDTESGWFAGSIEDVKASDASDVVTQEIETEQLRRRTMEDLPGRERCVLMRGYGLDGCERTGLLLGARGAVG